MDSESRLKEPGCISVLLIDDDAFVGLAFRRLLNGYSVVFSQSAEWALSRIEQGVKFDAIICDIHMPGMNGMRFHEELERIDIAAARQVIFVTGDSYSKEVSAFLKRVGNRSLVKPFGGRVLCDAVEHSAQELRNARSAPKVG